MCRSAATSEKYHRLPPKTAWARWTAAKMVSANRREGSSARAPSAEWLLAHSPETCPVLGVALDYSRGKVKLLANSPSVDRFYPTLGYSEGNVTVISVLANRIKTDATAADVHAVWRWMTQQSAARCAP